MRISDWSSDVCSSDLRWQPQPRCEITPARILPFDQVALPVARPLLHRLLACDYRFHCVGNIVPDEALAAVAFGEAVERAFAMLHDAADVVGGHADVQRAEIAIGHHVNRSEERRVGKACGSTFKTRGR